MTRDDIVELERRRQRFARRYWLPMRVWWLIVIVAVVMAEWLMRGDAYYSRLNSLGLVLLALASLVRGQIALLQAKIPSRYVDGPLIVKENRRRLGWFVVGKAAETAAFVLIGLRMATLGPLWLSAVLGLAAALAAGGSLVSIGWAVSRLVRPEPLLTVSDAGVFAPSVMRAPIAWKDIVSIPIATTHPLGMPSLEAPAAWGNHRSFWSRPSKRKPGTATHFLPGYAADASQADVLLAIENYRPDLVRALQLPASKGFAFTPAFAAR